MAGEIVSLMYCNEWTRTWGHRGQLNESAAGKYRRARGQRGAAFATDAATTQRVPCCLAVVEMIIVDDGSSDGTAAVAARALEGHDHTVIRLPWHQGKGAALRVGVAAARGERIVLMDADLAAGLDNLAELLAGLDTHDIAVGSDTSNSRRSTTTTKFVPCAAGGLASMSAPLRVSRSVTPNVGSRRFDLMRPRCSSIWRRTVASQWMSNCWDWRGYLATV